MRFVSNTAGKVLAAVALSVFALGAYAQKTQLSVYTALETDQLKAYKEGFEKANPDDRDRLGARLDRHRHSEAARRKSQSEGRRRDGFGRDQLGRP